MNENATANEANLEMVRLKGCSYPYRLTTASSSLSDAGVSVTCLSVTLSPLCPFCGVAQPHLIPFVLGVLAAPGEVLVGVVHDHHLVVAEQEVGVEQIVVAWTEGPRFLLECLLDFSCPLQEPPINLRHLDAS